MKNITQKIKKIKIVLTDVDGVLTDGGMYYSNKGDVLKKFHARDGMGVTLLKRNGIPTVIVTKEKTMMVKQWAKKMKIEKLYDGVTKKENILDKVCKRFEVSPENIAYIGDDVNDLGLMKKIGFSVVPQDGIKKAIQIADYRCKLNGGEGVLREVVDLIFEVKKIQNESY
jgi:3-deoxy-D-manno-octulosonate 8-phosphate phosphatase (KDO 8-P phosphatase)